MAELTFITISGASSPAKLRESFRHFRESGQLRGALAQAKKVDVKPIPEFFLMEKAAERIRLEAEVNGPAMAVPIRYGAGLDERGQRPLKWLVGAKYDPVIANRKTG